MYERVENKIKQNNAKSFYHVDFQSEKQLFNSKEKTAKNDVLTFICCIIKKVFQ